MKSRPDPADVGLVDARVDLHLRQVRGQYEQRRRLHARGHRLADVDAALRDDAVDRRGDDRVVQIDLVLIDGRLRLRDGRLGLRDRRLLRLQHGLCGIDRNFRRVEIALRHEIPGRELFAARVLLLRVDELHFGPLEIALRLGQVRLRLREVGLRLLQLRLEERRIELGDHLVLLDDRVEVGAEPGDVARHLAADLHRRHRLQRAGGADGVNDVAAADRRGLDLNVLLVAADVVGGAAAANRRDKEQDNDGFFHSVRLALDF